MSRTPIRRTPVPGSVSRPVVTPLMPSVVYASESPDQLDAQYGGQTPGYTYAREGHPNADVLAAKLDAMEGAEDGLIVGSGMAAVTATLMALLNSGDHVIGGNQLYGRSLRLLAEDLPRLGIAATLADPTDAAALAQAIRPETRMILIEVISNPTLRVADIAGIAALARERGLILAVDNTFTTPRAIRPFEHGADVVLHSVTKMLAGHSDVTLGYVAARTAEARERLRTFAVTTGLTPSPFDCWLAERGLLTFELRYDRAEENARRLADHLAHHPGVSRVLYPTREDHPDTARVRSLLGERGSHMVSFAVNGGRAAANALVRAVPQMAFAPTLGDVGTTLSHPATSSHRAMSEAERAALGIDEGFFRVSVGCEAFELLAEEFDTAIAASQAC